ncbi:hypothetical protein KI387_003019, partial [Taxus chinensis]
MIWKHRVGVGEEDWNGGTRLAQRELGIELWDSNRGRSVTEDMGKSPGKWLKTLLFGKKSTRSRSSEGLSRRDSTRENGKKSLKDQDVRSLEKESPQDHVPSAIAPLESSYISINGPVREQNKQAGYVGTDKVAVSTSIHKAVAILADEGQEKPSESCIQEDVNTTDEVERLREESAAIKAQAVFRGYLARKAFRALRGLIRLQALVRGHLVRRQAVGSLRCLQAIVRLQALVRGRRVRMSEQGLAIQGRLEQRHRKIRPRRNELDRKSSTSFVAGGAASNSDKTLANAFARQLLEFAPKNSSLRIDCGPDSSNSGWVWMARWMSAYPSAFSEKTNNNTSRKQKTSENLLSTEAEVERPKRNSRKALNSSLDHISNQPDFESEKPKRGSRKFSKLATDSVSDQPEAEAERPKRIFRKGFNSTMDSVSDQPEVEAEKVKRNMRRISHPSVDSASDHPEVEMEKVKRNLRKVSNSMADSSSDPPEVEAEKVKRSLRKVSNTTTDTVSDHPEVEPEMPKRSFRKVSKTTSDTTSEQPSMQATTVSSINISAHEEPVQHATLDQFSLDPSCIGHETVSVGQEVSPARQSQDLPESMSRDDDESQERMASSVSNGDNLPGKHENVDSMTKMEPELPVVEQKTGRRRSSFGSVKGDHADNNLQGSPSVPSYMAATESAKAKLRAQASPRMSPDVQEKSSAVTRRHSLPSASNGKQPSVSPRTHRVLPQVQARSKSDRSLGI